MPRANAPDELEIAITYGAHPDGSRRVEHATSFLTLYKDQFGTILITGQDCAELVNLLHPAVALEGLGLEA